MNIFINIYKNWTVYEWLLLGGSLLLIFMLSNLATYLLTKDWRFNLPISMTYVISALIYILILFIISFLPISHLSTISILLTALLITINWITFISYYKKFKNRKNFLLIDILKEQRKDTIRNIVFLTLAILSIAIFLRGELLFVMLTTYFVTSISMYLSTVLTEKFIHD